jgi:hypothetical protein
MPGGQTRAKRLSLLDSKTLNCENPFHVSVKKMWKNDREQTAIRPDAASAAVLELTPSCDLSVDELWKNGKQMSGESMSKKIFADRCITYFQP